MADYSSIKIQQNEGTDASPSWARDITFGGSAGANEMRFVSSTAGATTSTPSASWPYTTRPTGSPAVVDNCYFFTADTTGVLCTTYDGSNTNQNVFRVTLTNDGNMVSAPRFSAFADNTHPTPSPGTQVDNPTNGANIINGHATDTSSHSYLKGAVYGVGITNPGGAADVPPNSHAAIGTAPTATTGSSGAVTTSAGTWSSWQSFQGWTEYIALGAIPKPSTAGNINFSLSLWMGANMKPGVMPFCPVVFDYTYA